MIEADLVNGSKNGEMSRNSWICEDDTYHYCPICDTLEKCKDKEEPYVTLIRFLEHIKNAIMEIATNV